MTTQKQLHRDVGISGATLLGLGSILGTGVYFSVPDLTVQSGDSLILPIVVAGLLATCNALSSAQLAACYPVSGGSYEYGYRLLSPVLGFAAGWLFLCAKSASAATAALAATAYVFGNPSPGIAVAVTAGMTMLVIGGLKRSTWMNTLLVVVTVAGLLVFSVLSFQQNVVPGQNTLSAPRSTADFLQLAALLFVGFTGYGRVATLGEEIRDPGRSIPIAVVVTLVASAALYILVAAAVVRWLPLAGDAALSATLATLVNASGGWGTKVVAAGAVTAMLGVLLNLVLGLSRVVLAMARRHDLPAVFSALAGQQHTPTAAVLLVGGIIAVLVLLRDPRSAWSLSAVTVLIYYSITNLAALRLPVEHRLYPRWISVAGLLGCVLLAVHVDRESCLLGAAVLAVGFVLRFIFRTGGDPEK